MAPNQTSGRDASNCQIGTPGRIRTCYPRLRRPMLYPNELRAQRIVSGMVNLPAVYEIGRGREIRTPDILLPKRARYQTALYPVNFSVLFTFSSLYLVERLQNASCILPSGSRWRALKSLPAIFVELPTSCSQSRRATRLRYTPNLLPLSVKAVHDTQGRSDSQSVIQLCDGFF